ncbi:MAG: hypothetical protein H0Z33_00030 [Bacillaceae bacterium]|nr:hypothetical protein [Bacillaceae bacterium]
MKKLSSLILVFILLTLATGCTEEGQNLEGQKLVQFSLTQKGSHENWDVIDHISGTYYNLEKLYQSMHSLVITPKIEISNPEINVSIKINDEVLGYTAKQPEGEWHTVFKAKRTADGVFNVDQELSHQDDNDRFWDEDVTVIIEYGDQKDEIRLQ